MLLRIVFHCSQGVVWAERQSPYRCSSCPCPYRCLLRNRRPLHVRTAKALLSILVLGTHSYLFVQSFTYLHTFPECDTSGSNSQTIQDDSHEGSLKGPSRDEGMPQHTQPLRPSQGYQHVQDPAPIRRQNYSHYSFGEDPTVPHLDYVGKVNNIL